MLARAELRITVVLVALLASGTTRAQTVQDFCSLQGQRTNKLMGYGLVVGLAGTGDADTNANTRIALATMHKRFHQPVIDWEALQNAKNVAIVTVEAEIPEYGAREGQTIDVVVSAFSAISLRGGQLLTTPLQSASFDPKDPATQRIFAFAGGRIITDDTLNPARGIIRGGATLEADVIYNFVLNGQITLVLDDGKAGFGWAERIARVINIGMTNPAQQAMAARRQERRVIAPTYLARAHGPKNITVRIPTEQLDDPAPFIARVLETKVFTFPEQRARVVINRINHTITSTGAVSISPTTVTLPGLGLVTVGQVADEGQEQTESATHVVPFQEFLELMSKLQLSPRQMVQAVEQLHRMGAIHAELIYSE